LKLEAIHMIGFGSLFNVLALIPIVLYVLGIASFLMITISLIRIAQAQRSIARSLEHIEKLLENKP